METKELKVKKWGNSFGIIIPKDIVEKQDLKEGVTVCVNIQIKNKTKAKDIFGILKGKLGDTEKLMKEVDRDLWS
jgi:antitoxin component of MazEF toxin-antitoxin module